ncbi:MAG: transporter substrate-binding domain-containing protein [Myxococcota bacterium]
MRGAAYAQATALLALFACTASEAPRAAAPDVGVRTSSSSTVAMIGGRPMTSLEQELMRHTLQRYVGDVDEIKKRNVLRVLTRNNSSNYYLARGVEEGFQYELAKAFADELGVRLAMIVPSSRSELEAALLSGEGDLIAAGTTVTATRAQRVLFTSAIAASPRVLVVADTSTITLQMPSDLPKVEIHVSFRSTTYEALMRIQSTLDAPLKLVDVEDDPEMEEILGRVARGEYPATIADQDVVDLVVAGGLDVQSRMMIEPPTDKAWAVRPGSPELGKLADAFVKRHKRDGLIKIFYDRYYKSPRAARLSVTPEARADQSGRISPFDEIFRREAKRTGLDWRLLAAVAFTESRFDPLARSAWGAVGLMQLLPTTALAVGVTRLDDPAQNIRAGASYLRYLIDRFDEPGLEMRQKIRFALAAYNAGLGHITDARMLAEKTHRNPNIWFGSVEQALRLKLDRRWHELTRFGYCRAEEPIHYVSLVQSSYDVFARYAAIE